MDMIDGWMNGVRVILMGMNTATSLYTVLYAILNDQKACE